MPLMLWDQSLDVGVKAMNDEHVQILTVMNRIYDLHRAGASGEAINSLVGELGGVCTRHFADEERFMEKTAFPSLAAHKLLHAKLLERYGEFAKQIKAAGGRASDEFFRFLEFWLQSHIKGVDVKYGAHAKTSAVA